MAQQKSRRPVVNLTTITENSRAQDINNNFRKLQAELASLNLYLEPKAQAGEDLKKIWDQYLGPLPPISKKEAYRYTEEFTVEYAQKRISSSTTPPESPEDGDLWLDPSTQPPTFKRWNAETGEWEKLSATTFEELEGMIDKSQLPDRVIDSMKLAIDAVQSENIAPSSVDFENLMDDAVRGAKIAAEAVASIHIQNGAIGNEKLADLAVTAEKIADGAIDLEKISEQAQEYMNQQAREYTDAEIQKTAQELTGLLNTEIGNVNADIANLIERTDGVEGQLVTIHEDIDELDGKISTTITELNNVEGVVSEHTTTLAQHASLINAKAEKTEVYTRTETDDLLEEKVDQIVYNEKIGELEVSIDGISGRVSNVETNMDTLEGDVDSALSQVADLSIRADGIEQSVTEISGDIDDLGTRVTSAEGSITTLAGEVELKASQTEVDSLTGRMSQAESQISVLSDEIELKVDVDGIISAINLSEEGVTIAGSKIDVLGPANIADAAITEAKIAEAAVGTAAIQDLAVTNAKIANIHADKITAGVLAAERVAIGPLTRFAEGYDPTKIEVGGRNLLKGTSKDFEELSHSQWYGRVATVHLDDVGLKVGDTVTFSIYVKSRGQFGGRARIRWHKSDGTNHANSYGTDIQAGEEGRIAVTAEIPEETDNFYVAVQNYPETGTEYISDIKEAKLEKGNKATDWTPAPEDNPALLWQYEDTVYIDGGNIYANTITSNQIAAGAITTNELGANAVTANKIAANAVTANKIQAEAVGAQAIAANAILAKHIAAGEVTANHLAADAVTADAIAAGAILAEHLSSNSIEARHIKAEEIDANHLNIDTLSAISANLGNITAGNIAGVNITGATIQQIGEAGSLTLNDEGFKMYDENGTLRIAMLLEDVPGFHGDSLELRFYSQEFDNSPSDSPVLSIGHYYVDSYIASEGRLNLISGEEEVSIEANNPPHGIALSVRGGALSVADGAGVNNGILFSGGHVISVGPSSGDFTIYGDRSGGKSPFKVYSHTDRSGYRDDFYINSAGIPYVPNVWDNTSTNPNNVRVDINGQLLRYTSARRFKIDEKVLDEDPYKILALQPKDWYDKRDYENNGNSAEGLRRVPGLVAEDVENAGLKQFLEYEEDGRVAGLMYERLWVLLIPIIREQQHRIEMLENALRTR